MPPIQLDNANISRAEVAKGAQEVGLSKAELTKLADTLTKLAEGMSFGDGKALSALAEEIASAASQLGHATSPSQSNDGGFSPSALGTPHTPGT